MCTARNALLVLGALAGCDSTDSSGEANRSVDTPTLKYELSEGCGHIVVYAARADRREFLVVYASRSRLGLSLDEHTFDLSQESDALQVHVDMYSRPPEEPYCTDVAPAPGTEYLVSTWTARSGLIRITLFAPGLDTDGTPLETYRARVVLQSCVFEDGAGRSVKQGDTIHLEAEVGWLPG